MGIVTRVSLFSISALAASSAVANCGSAVCSINTDTEIQYEVIEPGFGVNLRYEFVDLDQPREGTSKVGARGEPGEHDELETTNHNLVLGLDYVIDQHWGVGVQIPYLNRKHSHIHNPDEDEIARAKNRNGMNGTFPALAMYARSAAISSILAAPLLALMPD